MQKLINDPDNFVAEMLEGILAAHPDQLKVAAEDAHALVRTLSPRAGKVGIVTGGGSGHLPLFLGYVGAGMLDGVAVGDVFASPSSDQILQATRGVDGGAGVLYLYGNYGGDVMNFDLASELAEAEGITTRTVVGADDVASAPKGQEELRRGIAGIVLLYKVAGAAAEGGASLDEVVRITQSAASKLRTFGVALSPMTLPSVGRPTFELPVGQSALWAEMQTITDGEAAAIGDWLLAKGMTFKLGTDEKTELTQAQLDWQYKMYISLLRIADDFGLDAVGIQYQQGLKDLSPASDLAEGLINNPDRPPVTSRDGKRVLWEGKALPLANEADEGVAIDALVTNRIWSAVGIDPATTLHDVRWGEEFDGQFVWVFEISGSVPPGHLTGGYEGAVGWRQNPVYFPLGGSTIKGVSHPGEIVWSRVNIADGELHLDLGRASVVELPAEETERRWQATNPKWPIMHAVLHGVDRNQFMARHKANHVNVVYAPDATTADRALVAKAAMFAELGVHVHLCGTVDI